MPCRQCHNTVSSRHIHRLGAFVIRAALFLSFCTVIALGILAVHGKDAAIKRWTLTDPDLPELKVAVFADFHLSSLSDVQALADLKRQIIAEAPDLVFFAGDYIGSTSLLNHISREEIAVGLAALAHPRPAFAVLGNHDNWDSRDAWLEAFAQTEIQVIENRVVTQTVNTQRVCIRGIGDLYSGYAERTPIPSSCRGTVVTLTHDPAGLLLDERPLESLSIAGHTHCGQITLPIIGALVVPTTAPKSMHCGLYKERHYGLTSGGLGASILPIRLGPNTEPSWDILEINRDIEEN